MLNFEKCATGIVLDLNHGYFYDDKLTVNAVIFVRTKIKDLDELIKKFDNLNFSYRYIDYQMAKEDTIYVSFNRGIPDVNKKQKPWKYYKYECSVVNEIRQIYHKNGVFIFEEIEKIENKEERQERKTLELLKGFKELTTREQRYFLTMNEGST